MLAIFQLYILVFYYCRKEEELYRIQLAKQEQREEGLAFENAKLKQLLNEVTQDLEEMLATDGRSARVRVSWGYF